MVGCYGISAEGVRAERGWVSAAKSTASLSMLRVTHTRPAGACDSIVADAVAFSFNCSALLCVTVVLRRTLIVKRYITATCITACTAKGHVSAAGMLEVVMGNTEVTKLLQSDGL
uniref:Uncharacterized protein n=1 Tax=Ascaris lumbricoides TaxID=6252 RepID=A0A0M3HV69_ASCLU